MVRDDGFLMVDIELNSDGSASEVDIRVEVKEALAVPGGHPGRDAGPTPTTYRLVSDFGNAILEQSGPDAARSCVEGMSIVWAIQRMKPRVVLDTTDMAERVNAELVKQQQYVPQETTSALARPSYCCFTAFRWC